ncbi:MAG: hypothetical protein AB7O32_05730 [Vicinamibacterales bacterium]
MGHPASFQRARATSLIRGRGFARALAIVLLASGLGAMPASRARAQDAMPVPLMERTRGAERVVVGRVASVSPTWRVNEFGDRLIVSVVRVNVDETLKGGPQPLVELEVEGGTIDGLTLNVSDQAELAVGERAVFYLSRNAAGRLVPHLRGQGVLKLDARGRVPDSSLTLDVIRREAAAATASPR